MIYIIINIDIFENLINYSKCNTLITLQISMSLRCAIHPDMAITHFCETCSDLVC